jgi:hypothetical protein
VSRLYTLARSPIVASTDLNVLNLDGVAVGTIRQLSGKRWGWLELGKRRDFPTQEAAALARLRYSGLRKVAAGSVR